MGPYLINNRMNPTDKKEMKWLICLIFTFSVWADTALVFDVDLKEEESLMGLTPEQIERLEALENWNLIQEILGVIVLPELPPLNQDYLDFIDNGGRGPGGGDVLLCEASSDNRFEGIYSYDYIQTRKSLNQENREEFIFPEGLDCLGHIELIHTKLKEVNPILASGLREFIDSLPLQNEPQISALRRWEPISYEDAPVECIGHQINDHTTLVHTPNCRRCQIFVRDYSQVRPSLLYTYDASLLNELSKRPKQCSYALIHEWARDFLPDSKDLYFFTRMLHEKSFHEEGAFSYQSLPEDIAHCLEDINRLPIDTDLLGSYLAIVSQVPPTPQELEQYQREIETRFREINESIDQRIELARDHPPLGMNQRQIDALINRVQNDRQEIQSRLDQKAISHAQAYANLLELRERLPAPPKPPEVDLYLFDQIINMEHYPQLDNTFRPPTDENAIPWENIKIISPARQR